MEVLGVEGTTASGASGALGSSVGRDKSCGEGIAVGTESIDGDELSGVSVTVVGEILLNELWL